VTEQQPQSKNPIPKPVYQAIAAAVVAGGSSFVFGVPIEYVPRVAVAGIVYSVFQSYSDIRYQVSPRVRRPRGRQIAVNTVNGSRKIDMEYSVSQGGYIVRETYAQAIKRFVFGKPQADKRQPEIKVNRPEALDDFIFRSHYQGQVVELAETHVRLFLQSAWRNRANGKGLSQRRWVRERSQRPAWYQELSPVWYYGMSMLLWDAQKALKRQLVIETGYQWYALNVEPRQAMGLLKWYESIKRQ